MRHFEDGRELDFGKNIIRKGEGKLFLPFCSEDAKEVELLLMDGYQYRIDGRGIPIRFNKHISGQVGVGGDYNNTDRNPKLVYDKEKNQWLLFCHGYIYFPEIELNCLPYNPEA